MDETDMAPALLELTFQGEEIRVKKEINGSIRPFIE
jgi:hypothetical protein